MTQFEFVQVTVAIILGLGLTDILRGLGEQYRHRGQIEVCWQQVGASCLLLLITLLYLWSFWLASKVTWTFPLFLIQAASAISLALSAQFLKVDISLDKPLETQYFDNGMATFVSWAMAPAFAAFFSFAAGQQTTVDIGRAVAAALLISLGLIKSRAYHKVVLTTLVLLVFLFGVLMAPVVGLFELGT